jgi:hypothetical protein
VHKLSSSFVLAYHGCDRSIAEDLLEYKKRFKSSTNSYDWLGEGIYFWESNPARALDWARHLQRVGKGRKKIRSPYVVGAVIDLGYCLDLVSAIGIEFVQAAYTDFRDYMERSSAPMPVNKGDHDLLQRHLDCAVINHIHFINERDSRNPFETVRGVFLEGERIYPTSGFFEKTHIQICVRNQANIKGIFRVPPDQLKG